ncbi:hypothetical protein J6590_000852 [Homalodisca vitripennis]|nr:hypothetical protein J6590_000852 [Homalodisca vitripennis]
MLLKRCSHHYSVACLKLDLARMVDRLSGSPASFQLLPGVSLTSHNITPSADLSAELAQALARDNSHNSLDDFLLSKVNHYIGSLTLSVKLAEPAALFSSKGISSNAGSDEARRRKNGLSGSLMTAGLFSGGTLMAVGMSALAALAGKALMTALLSLMLSAMAALRGGGDSGHKSTTYEIITKPVVSHAHTHSSEIQHEHGNHHAYAYGRSMESHPVYTGGLKSSENQTHEDSYVLAYRAHKPSIGQKSDEMKKE